MQVVKKTNGETEFFISELLALHMRANKHVVCLLEIHHHKHNNSENPEVQQPVTATVKF